MATRPTLKLGTPNADQFGTVGVKAKKSLGAILERMELIAVDTHKAFSYDKGSGLWSWFDWDSDQTFYGGFATRFAALVDATEPYMNGDNDANN